MYYTYCLQSTENGKIYTGFTGNLRERLRKHFSKGVHTTKRMKNIRLIFYEAYVSKSDAMRREKYLKSTKGKRTLKLMLEDTLTSGAFV